MYENLVNTSCRWLRRDDTPQSDGSFTYTEQSPVLPGVFTVQSQSLKLAGSENTVMIQATVIVFTEDIKADDRIVVDGMLYTIESSVPALDPVSSQVLGNILYLSKRGDYNEEPTEIRSVTERR